MYNELIKALQSPNFPEKPATEVAITHCQETTPILPLFDLYTQQKPEEGAVAQLWMDEDGLHMVALMQDSNPHSRAVKGDHTWEKGDVCEVFYQPDAEQKPYFEFHITPNQVTLEYYIPDAEQLIAGAYKDEDLLIQTPMIAEAEVFANGDMSGWIAKIDLPMELLMMFRQGAPKGKFAVCRYNERKDESLELSSTTVFPSPRYHQPHCWHTFQYVNPFN